MGVDQKGVSISFNYPDMLGIGGPRVVGMGHFSKLISERVLFSQNWEFVLDLPLSFLVNIRRFAPNREGSIFQISLFFGRGGNFIYPVSFHRLIIKEFL